MTTAHSQSLVLQVILHTISYHLINAKAYALGHPFFVTEREQMVAHYASPTPGIRRTLNLTLNITRHPPSIKVPRLSRYLLPINETFPGSHIERNVVFKVFV